MKKKRCSYSATCLVAKKKRKKEGEEEGEKRRNLPQDLYYSTHRPYIYMVSVQTITTTTSTTPRLKKKGKHLPLSPSPFHHLSPLKLKPLHRLQRTPRKLFRRRRQRRRCYSTSTTPNTLTTTPNTTLHKNPQIPPQRLRKIRIIPGKHQFSSRQHFPHKIDQVLK